MKIDIAVLADTANISQEGKLNITGIFDTLFATALPAVQPQMSLVIRLRHSAGEKGHNYPFEINLIDEDGNIIHKMPPISISIPIDSPSNSSAIPVICLLQGQTFPKYGHYRFDVLVNGNHEAEIPILLTQPKR